MMEKYGEQLTIDEINSEDEAEIKRLERTLVLGSFASELGME